mmetsp:Transcript_6398/g.12018  ORF Transcript_6398/g.12018 Transcript_6398/m.12018 type:complete len:279 (+) Transcript_6398:109-945(+)
MPPRGERKKEDSGASRAEELVMAVRRGSLSQVRALLQDKANIDAPTARGWNALHYAVMSTDISVVRFLVDCGADINCTCRVDGQTHTALATAVRDGNFKVAKYLIDKGASVTPRDRRTLLMLAKSDVQIMRYLIEHEGVDVNATDDSGRTVLMLSARDHAMGMLRYLVEEARANLDARDKMGRTALDWASRGRGLLAHRSRASSRGDLRARLSHQHRALLARKRAVKFLSDTEERLQTKRATKVLCRDLSRLAMLHPLIMEAYGSSYVLITSTHFGSL